MVAKATPISAGTLSNPHAPTIELTQIIGDVIADPTLPRTDDHPCPRCGHKESVFFQSHSTRAEAFNLALFDDVYEKHPM
ncbi:RPB9-like protein [Mya arenaria]|uniref:RPB9-like protein n=1 Tax=Mya arenaria TaxID=6604 RepID=A0ABY7FEI3_MYAAR|nr:RPB9-like protein [Mya arenaria]